MGITRKVWFVLTTICIATLEKMHTSKCAFRRKKKKKRHAKTGESANTRQAALRQTIGCYCNVKRPEWKMPKLHNNISKPILLYNPPGFLSYFPQLHLATPSKNSLAVLTHQSGPLLKLQPAYQALSSVNSVRRIHLPYLQTEHLI